MGNLEQMLDKSRIILVTGYIQPSTATEIITKLINYNIDSEEAEIQLYVSAVGGCYLDTMAIYDTIKAIKAPVVGIGIGHLTNYSLLLLANCTKGKRYALKHTEFSLEQPFGHLGAGANQQTEILIEAKSVRQEREVFEGVISSATGVSLEKVHADCENGLDLNAQEAISYGIIDKVIGG